MSDSKYLLKNGRELARRHALLNRIRIGLLRIVRATHKDCESRRLAEESLAEVRREIELNREWREFERELADTYADFLADLARTCPELTEAERSVLLLTRVGFSTKEIADILFITTRGVQTHRYRAKRKMKESKECSPSSSDCDSHDFTKPTGTSDKDRIE